MGYPNLKAAFTQEMLGGVYERIQIQPFESKVNLHERYFKRINEMSYSLVQKGLPDNAKVPSIDGAKWQKKHMIKRKASLQDPETKRNNQLLKEQGTVFVKYGRHGQPKQRLVYLSRDETEILWRDRLNEKEKPRKMLIKDLDSVRIGSDHTTVMRKQKIHP